MFKGETIDSFYVFYLIVNQRVWVSYGPIWGNMIEGGALGGIILEFYVKASCLVLNLAYYVDIRARAEAGKYGYFNF